MVTLSDLGHNIRKIRESKNINQNVLAEKASMTGRSLCRIEKDGANLKISTLLSIADALNIDVRELLGKPKELQTTNNARIKHCIELLKTHLD